MEGTCMRHGSDYVWPKEGMFRRIHMREYICPVEGFEHFSQRRNSTSPLWLNISPWMFSSTRVHVQIVVIQDDQRLSRYHVIE